MIIEIRDELLADNSDSKDLIMDVALQLFEKEKITLGKAADLAGVSKMEMQYFIGSKGVPMHYDLNMVEEDLEVIKWYQNHGSNK